MLTISIVDFHNAISVRLFQYGNSFSTSLQVSLVDWKFLTMLSLYVSFNMEVASVYTSLHVSLVLSHRQ